MRFSHAIVLVALAMVALPLLASGAEEQHKSRHLMGADKADKADHGGWGGYGGYGGHYGGGGGHYDYLYHNGHYDAVWHQPSYGGYYGGGGWGGYGGYGGWGRKLMAKGKPMIPHQAPSRRQPAPADAPADGSDA